MSWQALASFGLSAAKGKKGGGGGMGDKSAATADGGNSVSEFGDFIVEPYESEVEQVVKASLAAGALFLGYKWITKSKN